MSIVDNVIGRVGKLDCLRGMGKRSCGTRDVIEGCTASRQRLIHVLEHTGLISKPLPTSGTKRSLLCEQQGLLCFWHERMPEAKARMRNHISQKQGSRK